MSDDVSRDTALAIPLHLAAAHAAAGNHEHASVLVNSYLTSISDDPVKWNPYNKVVQDHRDGSVDVERTDRERAARGLPTPWVPHSAYVEVSKPPVY